MSRCAPSRGLTLETSIVTILIRAARKVPMAVASIGMFSYDRFLFLSHSFFVLRDSKMSESYYLVRTA